MYSLYLDDVSLLLYHLFTARRVSRWCIYRSARAYQLAPVRKMWVLRLLHVHVHGFSGITQYLQLYQDIVNSVFLPLMKFSYLHFMQ